jgi:uncharacterized damage-inducible protein DinB
MREIVTYYANCNRQINELMNTTIAAALPRPYEVPLGGYFFKTLGQILDHLVCSDLIWMAAFSALDTAGMDLAAEVHPVPTYGDALFADFDAYLACRRNLDGFICQYMDQVDESLFSKTVDRKTRDGQLMRKAAPKALVHFFNHQTHHRGQISAILDGLNIENNYSNMIFLEA